MSRAILIWLVISSLMAQPFARSSIAAGPNSASVDPYIIAAMVNQMGTPANVISLARLVLGNESAQAVKALFTRRKINLDEPMPRIDVSGGAFVVRGSRIATFSGNDAAKLWVGASAWTYDPKSSLGENLHRMEKSVFENPSPSKTRLENWLIPEAHADDLAMSDTVKAFAAPAMSLLTIIIMALVGATVWPAVVLAAVVGGLTFLGTHLGGSGKSSSLACGSADKDEIKLSLGDTSLAMHLSGGKPKSLDLMSGNALQNTYYFQDNWTVSGGQAPGKSAEIPLKRALTTEEQAMIGAVKALATSCKDPQTVGKLQSRLNQLSSGSAPAVNGPANVPAHDSNAGNASG